MVMKPSNAFERLRVSDIVQCRIHIMPHTYFSHTSGHPQGGASSKNILQKPYILKFSILQLCIGSKDFVIYHVMRLPEDGHRCARNIQEANYVYNVILQVIILYNIILQTFIRICQFHHHIELRNRKTYWQFTHLCFICREVTLDTLPALRCCQMDIYNKRYESCYYFHLTRN